MAGNFEIYTDSDKLYHFRLLDERGDVLVTSAGYCEKNDAVTAINAVRENASMGLIRDHSETTAQLSHLRRRVRRLTA